MHLTCGVRAAPRCFFKNVLVRIHAGLRKGNIVTGELAKVCVKRFLRSHTTATFPRPILLQNAMTSSRERMSAEAEGYRSERSLVDCVAPPSTIHQCPRADSWLLRDRLLRGDFRRAPLLPSAGSFPPRPPLAAPSLLPVSSSDASDNNRSNFCRRLLSRLRSRFRSRFDSLVSWLFISRAVFFRRSTPFSHMPYLGDDLSMLICMPASAALERISSMVCTLSPARPPFPSSSACIVLQNR